MFSAVKPSVSSLRTTRLPRPLASCTSATASTNCVRFYAVSASAEKQMKQQEELTAQRIRDRKLANNLDVQHWMQSNSPTGAKNFIIKNENNLHPRNFVVRNQVRLGN